MLGLFSLNSLGATGSVMYMINHGLSTGALFLCIGMIYERYHTKDMDQLGGLFKRMPVWSFFMVFFTLASLGLPGLNGFIGEFLCLMGAYTAEPGAATGYPGLLGPWWALVAGLGLVLAAMYLLIMLGKLVWGPLREPNGHGHGHGRGGAHGADHGHGASHASELPTDLNAREIGILVPLAVLCLAIGFYPKPMLEVISPSVDKVLAAYPKHVERYVREGTLLDGKDAAPQGIAATTPSVR
jgi:NADH-quinone oxidoreductase subunit M